MTIDDILKRHKKNVTNERKEIYQGIQDMHLFQANEIVEKFPHIGRASIFRILQMFVEIGVLRKLYLDDRGDFYELAHHPHHEHFTCSQCHKVLHFDTGILCKTLDLLAKKQGFLLKNHQILLSGLCPHCNLQ